MSQTVVPVFNVLIRTHHITSRKKVAKLVKATDKYACYVLLRSGGSPGIIYCEGDEEGVKSWVSTVQKLRYKDYQLVSRPNTLVLEKMDAKERPERGHLHEVVAVKEFGARMESLGIWEWWRHAMGYTP